MVEFGWAYGEIMNSKKTVLTAVCLALVCLHCGEPVTDTSYRGAPLFTFDGQVDVESQFPPGTHNVRLSIFWLPEGGDTPVEKWVEQSSASMAIEFPSSFKVRIFHPPSPEHYFFGQAIGRFMLYDDVNANGRRDGDEAFVGTSTNQGILYLPDEEAASKNILGLELEPGFTLVHHPIRCFERVPRVNDLVCKVPIGKACEVREDCCPPDEDCSKFAVACLKDLAGERSFPRWILHAEKYEECVCQTDQC